MNPPKVNESKFGRLLQSDKGSRLFEDDLGSINELEDLVLPLICGKPSLFLVNWLLIDPAERNDGSDYIDYDSQTKSKLLIRCSN